MALIVVLLLFISIFFHQNLLVKFWLSGHWYLILLNFLFFEDVYLGGIIEKFRPVFSELFFQAFFPQVIGFVILSGLFWLAGSGKPFAVILKTVSLGAKSALLFLFFLSSAIAYPSVYFEDAPRFNLLPGSGWAVFYLGFGVLNLV